MVQRAALYARVSTTDQSCERQIAELTAYAERSGFEIVAIVKETASGAKKALLQKLPEGGQAKAPDQFFRSGKCGESMRALRQRRV